MNDNETFLIDDDENEYEYTPAHELLNVEFRKRGMAELLGSNVNDDGTVIYEIDDKHRDNRQNYKPSYSNRFDKPTKEQFTKKLTSNVADLLVKSKIWYWSYGDLSGDIDIHSDDKLFRPRNTQNIYFAKI